MDRDPEKNKNTGKKKGFGNWRFFFKKPRFPGGSRVVPGFGWHVLGRNVNIPLVLKGMCGRGARRHEKNRWPPNFFAYQTCAFLKVLVSRGQPPAIPEGGIVKIRPVLYIKMRGEQATKHFTTPSAPLESTQREP